MTLRGPETRATPLGDCPGDGEWLGILLKLGTFLPLMPTRTLVDAEVNLPAVSRNSFWLFGSAWQLPDYDNADTFVDWLVRKDLLAREPIVDAALQGHLKDRSLSTIQRRFLRATGLTQSAARQIERARYATHLLQQGVSILDTVEQAGYFDQPHLISALSPSGCFRGRKTALSRHQGEAEAETGQNEDLSFRGDWTVLPAGQPMTSRGKSSWHRARTKRAATQTFTV